MTIESAALALSKYDIKHTFAFSRRIARVVPDRFPQKRGRRECRVSDAPAARVQKNAHGRRHRFTGINRHSLRNGFNGLLRALPGDEFLFVTVVGELTVLRNPVGFATPPPT
jgi:hypothetical protein